MKVNGTPNVSVGNYSSSRPLLANNNQLENDDDFELDKKVTNLEN